MESTLHKLAGELSEALIRDERANGDKFVKLCDGSPKWMTEVIHAVHGDRLPNDTIYSFCELAADAMAETDKDADEDAMRDAVAEIEPPCYTHEQMRWFAGNWEYCDQAIEEGLWQSDTIINNRSNYGQVTTLVTVGMSLHIREVGEALLAALVARAEELEANLPTCSTCGAAWEPDHKCQ